MRRHYNARLQHLVCAVYTINACYVYHTTNYYYDLFMLARTARSEIQPYLQHAP